MGKRIFDGYMVKGNSKKAFEIKAGSKQSAHKQMKEEYPDWRIYIVGYHTGKRIRR